jgi:hypothetical protein
MGLPGDAVYFRSAGVAAEKNSERPPSGCIPAETSDGVREDREGGMAQLVVGGGGVAELAEMEGRRVAQLVEETGGGMVDVAEGKR